MSKETEKLSGEISQTASVLSVLRGLTEHPGWSLYHEMLREQQDARKGDILLKPLKSTEEVYNQEFMKGEISGLILAQVSIFAHIEGLAAQVQVATAKLEKENELETQSAADAGRTRVDGNTFGE